MGGKTDDMAQPRAEDYGYDLDAALRAVVTLSSRVPDDAFTAGTLGTERAGNAVVINGTGLLVTIGYLITEAQSVWLTLHDGRVVPAHALGFDQESGFGLVQALGTLDVPPLQLGRSADVEVGSTVVVAGAGGRRRSVAARVVARQPFSGYWEYLLEDALFTAPAHPHWGGTALLGSAGELLGIGSLQLQQERVPNRVENLNMIVPIDLLPPVLDDIATLGRPNRPARPWLGVFATEVDGAVTIAGLIGSGPAETAGMMAGDTVLSVDGTRVGDLAEFFRAVWRLGEAGTTIPITVQRDSRIFDVRVQSVDRYGLLKRRVLH